MRAGEKGPEEILEIIDPGTRTTAFIVIDSTRLGPAYGGIRVHRYERQRDALIDALDLAAAMTLKAALTGLPCGGGKIVLIECPGLRRHRAWQLLGEALNTLGGRFIAGRDSGMSRADLAHIRRISRFAANEISDARWDAPGTSIRRTAIRADPVDEPVRDFGDATARGTIAAIRAALLFAQGGRSQTRSRLTGRGAGGEDPVRGTLIAVQGLGSVGGSLVRRLLRAGARVIAADLDSTAARRASTLGVRIVAPGRIASAAVDVFVPAAVGGTLDERFARRCRARIVCGPANNALASRRAEEILVQRGVLVVPDVLAGAGGLIAGALRTLPAPRRDPDHASPSCPGPAIDEIGARVAGLLAEARRRGSLPSEMARTIALRRLRAGSRRGRR